MAETVVSLVIQQLIPLLTKEVKLLRGVHQEVTDIIDELESIRAVLKDADVRLLKGDVNEGMKTWMKQLRDEAYHMKDVIDEYMLHVARRRDQHGIKGFLHRLARLVKKLKPCHEIASEIQNSKRSVREIKERSERYGFSTSEQGESSSANNNTYDPRKGSLFIEEGELVGVESPRDELVSKLVEGASTRTVVSVVGMGGLGKTTLAKKVYDDQRVKAHFDCHAWITVSQSYNNEELLRSMIRHFYQSRMEVAPLEIDTMNSMSLIKKLREFLQRKKYVVVFDDVWKVEFWGDIEHALLDNNNGSRIIITTRSVDVAEFCNALCYVHKLQHLPLDMALELFYKKAFRFDNGGHCPPELEKLSSDIVKKCEGLPLAIVAFGGVMATKGSDVSKWRNFLDSLNLELQSNQRLTCIQRILTLSYHDLPYHLKSCFLYFGMFQEDYSIHCSRLIRLWIANGFIKEKEGVTVEAVAESYLSELIHRSLVQVEQFKVDAKAKTCRVHDLLREVILSRSDELSFNQVSVENYSSSNGIARHLSICNRQNNIQKMVSKFQTRSIILLEVNELSNPLIIPFFTKFKLLNVLDFEGAPLDYIPKELGNVVCLNYLSLRKTNVKVLPKSIGKLQNLQTLDLRESLVDELQVEMNRFPKLRYLFAKFLNFDDNSWHGIKIQDNVGCLEALQKLYALDIEHASMNLINELGKLKQLRKLGIKNLKREKGMAMCEALEKMTLLESLMISSTSQVEFLELQSISRPPLLLQRLWLQGRLEKFPDWISKLKSLVRIRLQMSRLMDDPLKILQALPNLLELVLYDAYDGEQLHFRGGCFQKLKSLHLLCMSGKLIIDEGALLSLGELVIAFSPQLKEVYSGLQHLTNLKLVQLLNMPREFALSVLPNQGPDHSKIEHIPSIYFSYAESSTQFRMYELRDSDFLEILQS